MTADEEVVINLMQVGDEEAFKQDQYCVEFEKVRMLRDLIRH